MLDGRDRSLELDPQKAGDDATRWAIVRAWDHYNQKWQAPCQGRPECVYYDEICRLFVSIRYDTQVDLVERGRRLHQAGFAQRLCYDDGAVLSGWIQASHQCRTPVVHDPETGLDFNLAEYHPTILPGDSFSRRNPAPYLRHMDADD